MKALIDLDSWADVVGYEGLYQVHPLGYLKSEMGILKTTETRYGYGVVGLWSSGCVKQCRVHRLVAQAFIANPDNKPEVNHLDEDKLNNVSNLEWCTSSENSLHSAHKCRGSNNYKAKLSEVEVGVIVCLIELGVSLTKIAKVYGVSTPAIYKISKGISWNWLTGRRKL